MSAYWHVRVYLQTGTENRGSGGTQRATDRQYLLGDKACCVAKELVHTINSVGDHWFLLAPNAET